MKTWEKAAFIFLVVSFFVFFLKSVWNASDYYLADRPAFRGEITEGIIGAPRFVNPVLATSDTDKDMIILVYSGLMRADNQGKIIPDLAEKYETSEDGLVYTFTIKQNLFWHDGASLTVDDIIFTIKKIKDPAMKSPKRANWEGIEVEKINEKSVRFVLKKPYAPFLDNTTIGILPSHIWNGMMPDQIASSEINLRPVGSGPYKIIKINRNSLGAISSYEMVANKNFAPSRPNIKKLIVKFYSSEKDLLNAYQNGEVENISAVNPESLEKIKKDGVNIKALYLPKIFGVFFNQNNAKIFAKKEVRQALNVATDRKKLINDVLGGFGTELYNPLPSGTFGAITGDDIVFSPEEAKTILKKNGWKMNEKENVLEKKDKKETLKLSFSISTADTPELRNTAALLKTAWEQIGARVEIKVFEIGDLNQNVIRPRKYEALLFGETTGREPDLLAFWHSSQRNDPGLNIALYANAKTDKILDEARMTGDDSARAEKYEEFQKELKKDVPAIFLFSPKLIYLTNKNIKGMDYMQNLATPSERFSMIHKWYKETDKVLKNFH